MKKRFLLLLIPFLFISHVKANEVGADIPRNTQTQIELPPTAQCFNSSYDAINTRFSQGQVIEEGFIIGSSTYNCSFGSRGVYSFSTNFLTDESQLYSLAVYVGNSSGYGLSSFNKLGIADSTYVARNQIVYNGSNATLFSSRLLSNAGEFYDPTGNVGNPLTYVKYSIIYIVFSAHSNSNSIAIDFSWNGSPVNSYLFGYHLEPLGPVSNLSQSDVSRIVNNATRDLASQSSINALQETENQIKQGITDVNDTLNNDDVTESTNEASDFFNGFTTDTHGLTAIITAPLTLISSITSKSCSPLVLPLPFVDKDLTLPCMGAIYSQYFGSFLSIYQLITFGIVAYWVCVRIFNLVKDFKNPDHDEIEVLDL